MKAVYTELHRSHDPQFFLVRGVVKRTTEQPERADRLLAALKTGRHELIEPTTFGQGPRLRVHSPEYLRFLAEAWEAWSALGDAGPEMIANIHPVRNAPGALVVALGLDAFEHDPLAGLAVTTGGFRRIGAAIARLGLPTVFVQEGGYLSDSLGANLAAVLGGFEGAR